MSQYEKITDHIYRQIAIISKKLKSAKNSREVTNKEIELLLCKTLVANNHEGWNDHTEALIEEMHTRLTRLSEAQMYLINLRYWECLTIRQIAIKLNQPKSNVARTLAKCLETLRK